MNDRYINRDTWLCNDGIIRRSITRNASVIIISPVKRLLPHAMGFFQRFLDNRIRDIGPITMSQAKNYRTTNAVHANRLHIKKYHKKPGLLYIAFLDVEKAFNRVPHKLI